MNALIEQTAEMLSILPDDEVLLVNELVKKLIVAWDPDYTKVTPAEKAALEMTDREMKNSQFYSEADV